MGTPREFFRDDSEAGPIMFRYLNRKALASCEIILGVTGIAANLSICMAILIDRKLRQSSKHFIILNVCLVCLIQIAILGTANTFNSITKHEVGGPSSCFTIVMESIGFFSVSVVLLLVCAVCVNEYLGLLLPHTTGSRLRLCVAAELTLCCWFGTGIIIIPLVVYGKSNPSSCDFHLKGNFQILLGLMHYLPQAVLLFFVGILLLLCSGIRRGREPITPSSNEIPIDILAACLVTVTFNLPFCVFYTAFNQCSPQAESCTSMYMFWIVASRLSFSTFVVLPFVWLLDRRVRHSLCRIVGLCRPKPRVNTSRSSYVSVSTDIDLRI